MYLLLIFLVYLLAKRIANLIYERRSLFWSDCDFATQATFFHCDLSDKIMEMLQAGAPYREWEDLLPVCIYADDWFYSTHPYLERRYSKEILVRSIMATLK